MHRVETANVYELLEVLGRGGMGVVYKARQVRLNRLVAVKTIPGLAPADPVLVRRFRIEAEALSRLHHRHIVRILDAGEAEGVPFLVMEYVEGGTLKQLLGKPRSPRLAARLLVPLAGALHYAHQAGVVHRDLSPDNVLLQADGTPLVADLGLAKLLDNPNGGTRDQQIMGKVKYLSPEQARSQSAQAGPAADVHALGVMLYELLVGRPPFLGANDLETLVQVRDTEAVPPSAARPKLPPLFDDLCRRCLDKDPARRPAALAVARELNAFRRACLLGRAC
jgi:serine/threonine protein kinase